MNKNSKNGRNKRRGINSRNRPRRMGIGGSQSLTGLARMTDQNAYGGQEKVILSLEGTPTLLTNTVTTGLLASSIPISVAQITAFNTRFVSTFDEFRILKCRFKIRPVTPNAPGISVFMFDEKSTNAPALIDAQERAGLRFPNTSNSSSATRSMTFRTSDLLDLQYTQTGTAVTIASFKVYTDATDFGAPIVATPLWLIEPLYEVEFRGVKAA